MPVRDSHVVAEGKPGDGLHQATGALAEVSAHALRGSQQLGQLR